VLTFLPLVPLPSDEHRINNMPAIVESNFVPGNAIWQTRRKIRSLRFWPIRSITSHSIAGQSIACLSVCLSVSLCVCPSARISPNALESISSNFLYMLPVAVARSSSFGSAICYVLMYLRFVDDAMFSHNGTYGPKSSTTLYFVAAPGAKSAVSDCILCENDVMYTKTECT